MDFMSAPAQLNFLDQDHTVEWSEANLCLCWVTKSDGRAWFDWWENKQNYEREFLLNLYRDEREKADLYNHGRMTPFDLVWSYLDKCAKEEEALIDRWAQEIRTAAAAMKPMPFLSPEAVQAELGYMPLAYPGRLAAAIMRAGVVIIERPAEPDAKPRRRRQESAT
jgi:hypothetical protein